jgi:hypothetical protein
MFAWLRHRLHTLRCPGCGLRFDHLYRVGDTARCNPCITGQLKAEGIVRRLERDGILTIVKEG